MISEMERLILKSDLIPERNENDKAAAPPTQNGNHRLFNKLTNLFKIHSECCYAYDSPKKVI